MSIRRFLDLLMFAGIIWGSLQINYLWTRMEEMEDLSEMVFAICIVVFSIVFIFINRATEVDSIVTQLRKKHWEERNQQEQNAQQTIQRLQERLTKLEAHRNCLLRDLAKLVDILHKSNTNTDTHKVRRKLVDEMMWLLADGAPFAHLDHVSPLALRDVVKECFDSGYLDVIDGPEWQRRLMNFALADDPESTTATTF